jgi:hypothetical protein
MGPARTFSLQLGDGWVLCRPDIDRLVVLNATGKTVYRLLCDGFGQQEIASAFAEHFGLPAEGVLANIRGVIVRLEDARFLARAPGRVATKSCTSPLTNGLGIQSGPNVHCGTFQFGNRRVQIHSTLPDIGRAYFSRFRHRAVDSGVDADVLEFASGSRCTA